jgi:hypothetical protein
MRIAYKVVVRKQRSTKGNDTMTAAFEQLNARQAKAARKALGREISIADHIQAKVSDVDGWAWVEVFVGRSCHTATIGPRGGVKFIEKVLVA